MRCDGTPDPTILGQINTYINLNTEEDTNIELKEALDKNHLTLAVSSTNKWLVTLVISKRY